MATRLENLIRIRAILGTPYISAPSFNDILRQELSEELDIVNRLSNTGKAWAVETYTFNYSANDTGTFALNVSNIGKILFVVRVMLNNQYVPALPVPISDFENQPYGTLIGNYYGIYSMPWAYETTLEKMAFYRTGTVDQEYMVQVQPMPQESAVYEIYYVPGGVDADAALSSATAMPEFSNLVQLRAATALLPLAKWYEDEKENREKRKELAASYLYQLERKEMLFASYIGNLTKPRTQTISDWNSDY